MNMMSPEALLDMHEYSAGTPAPAISDRARRVMEKYNKSASNFKADEAPKKISEPVLLAKPAVKQDAPLLEGEKRAKALKEMAAARARRLLSDSFHGWRSQPPETPPVASSRQGSAKPRHRAVASVMSARADMPGFLGGEAEPDSLPAAPDSELETVEDVAASEGDNARAAQSGGPNIAELEEVWVASVEELYEDGRAFCVRYSPDGTLLAAGCGDGKVRVVHASSGRAAYTLAAAEEELTSAAATAADGLPATCIRWTGGRQLLASTAAGSVECWKVGPSSTRLHAVTEEQNQIYALELRTGGGRFATAGRDTCVRIYDESRMECVSTFGLADEALRRYEGASGQNVGHTSRVFSLRFDPGDPHLLVSAGWDSVIRFWDLRSGETTRTISGAHVCGDSLDIAGNELLVGSFAATQALRVYDVRTAALVDVAAWEAAGGGASRAGGGCKLYAAQFAGEASGLCAAAGVGSVDGLGEVRVFRRDGLTPVGRASSAKGVYSLDVTAATLTRSGGGCRVAVTGGDHKLRVFDVRGEAAEVI